ncbi:ABC transporter ATP-binding protein [Streptococcus mutans]|jgi:putative ABC transporter, ATP-binding protein|uniref:Putative ABC transporter, ATP-binding protein n=1 Tax=Streptococcus mutans SM6 TaxID=857119 RepID=A0A829BTS0_STRMG|nr:ABC transporter ATP-binding protein [Streptococcus mutans]EMB97849.1 putative ABC transporter, ATP-binding protein [Streptococcus mutans M21]EMC25408.1 putative ABC transporter, ATP-binding protein [Streptococcus mutans SM6]EMP65789.1 ABC transporter ATP-binding protein [Streptococcus mutans KK23]MCB4938801.1 ABC transporter ATP-binding protein [Streptococcus mutans]MCB5040148.1 ABC transporter ATP-binding protein [Streptococcus mutans]
MNTPVIVAKDIRKIFNKAVALDAISFSIEKGQIFGFLGPSGSGKTTTINILTGQLMADNGQSSILGQDSRKLTSQELGKIGLVGDTSGFYEKISLYNNLLFYSKYYGIDKTTVDNLLKRVGLYDSRKTVAEKLSTGMKQRMLLARALINKPRVLFLDEPTSGLDPATSQTIHSLILELKAAGTAIFLTTHDMNEATLLCDKLALLNEGRLVEQGSPKDLIQKYNQNKQVKLSYQDGSERILDFTELGQAMASDSEKIIAIHSCEPTLEDIFIQLTGGKLNV